MRSSRKSGVSTYSSTTQATRHRPFLELNDADWDFVLAVDLKGVFYCAAAPHMIRQRYGKVLNISSISGTGASSHHAGGSPAGNS